MFDWLISNPLGVVLVAIAGFVLGRITAKSPQHRERERRDHDAAVRKIKAGLKPETVTAVRDLIARKRLIEAVKLVREEAGCDLKEAKGVAEEIGRVGKSVVG